MTTINNPILLDVAFLRRLLSESHSLYMRDYYDMAEKRRQTLGKYDLKEVDRLIFPGKKVQKVYRVALSQHEVDARKTWAERCETLRLDLFMYPKGYLFKTDKDLIKNLIHPEVFPRKDRTELQKMYDRWCEEVYPVPKFEMSELEFGGEEGVICQATENTESIGDVKEESGEDLDVTLPEPDEELIEVTETALELWKEEVANGTTYVGLVEYFIENREALQQ